MASYFPNQRLSFFRITRFIFSELCIAYFPNLRTHIFRMIRDALSGLNAWGEYVANIILVRTILTRIKLTRQLRRAARNRMRRRKTRSLNRRAAPFERRECLVCHGKAKNHPRHENPKAGFLRSSSTESTVTLPAASSTE